MKCNTCNAEMKPSLVAVPVYDVRVIGNSPGKIGSPLNKVRRIYPTRESLRNGMKCVLCGYSVAFGQSVTTEAKPPIRL